MRGTSLTGHVTPAVFALGFSIAIASCGQSGVLGGGPDAGVATADGDPQSGTQVDAAETADTAVGAGDVRPTVDINGRWTSSRFEDPFEAEFRWSGQTLSGRVCGPSFRGPPLAAGDNCGVLEAAWINGIVHFDFDLPWPDLASPASYQFVGTFNDADRLAGVLLIDYTGAPTPDAQQEILWTRCPSSSSWCP